MISSDEIRYLIIGGDSTIGRQLARILKKLQQPFICTSRKKNIYEGNSLFLDLRDNLDGWEPPQRLKAVFFCAAITSMEFCEKEVSISRLVNVVNTVKLIKKLSQSETPVIFLSSNQVFDGLSSYPDEKALTSPQTEYGHQKRNVEEAIEEIKINHSIVRVTKVINNNYKLFDNWISCLKQGIPIDAFVDYYFSPVPINTLGNILIQIAESKEGGVWHVSGNKDISYYDAALLIAKSVGADTALVKSTIVRDKLKNFYLPPSTALKCDRIGLSLGIWPPDVMATIKAYNIVNSTLELKHSPI